jgi:energy-coupling factor transporter ATP-binding protein EcfA2
MLEVRNLSVHYQDCLKLLDNLSFQLKSGEILWLRGPNGSGKTTLLYSICNIIPQMIEATRTGKIYLDGDDITSRPLNLMLPDLSFSMSNPNLEFFFANPEDEIIFALENAGFSEAEIKARLERAINHFGLQKFRQTHTHHLSAGWQKMASLAVQAAISPRILLLDEPLNGLSPDNIGVVIGWVKDYLSGGNCLVVAEHSEAINDLNPIVLNLDKVSR